LNRFGRVIRWPLTPHNQWRAPSRRLLVMNDVTRGTGDSEGRSAHRSSLYRRINKHISLVRDVGAAIRRCRPLSAFTYNWRERDRRRRHYICLAPSQWRSAIRRRATFSMLNSFEDTARVWQGVTSPLPSLCIYCGNISAYNSADHAIDNLADMNLIPRDARRHCDALLTAAWHRHQSLLKELTHAPSSSRLLTSLTQRAARLSCRHFCSSLSDAS